MTKQRKSENGETSVVKAQVTICLYIEFRWRNCPDKIHYYSHYNLRTSALVLFAVTVNYLFSKYRLQSLVFKIPAPFRPLLN